VKKAVAFVVLLLIGGLVLSSSAEAAWDRFENVFMTNAQGSSTPQNTFGWNETPWLYVKLKGGADNLATNWWKIGDYAHNLQVVRGHSDSDWYISLANWHTSGIKRPGNWQVYIAGFFNDGSMYQENCAFFTVTPEPLSSTLFVLGAAALAGKRFSKSKQLNRTSNPRGKNP